MTYDEVEYLKPEDYQPKQKYMSGLDIAIGCILLTIITLLCLDILLGYSALIK